MEVFWLLEAMQHKSWGIPISEISGIRNHEYTINTEQFLGEEVKRVRAEVHYRELLAQRLEQLQMNMLLTAVEKLFLSIDGSTQVRTQPLELKTKHTFF